jgi:transcription initiation factor IIE alpha subunit
MAFSSCPKCNNSFFEIVENTPARSNFKLQFVQCSSCGAVVGVMEYFNTGAKIAEVLKEIETLKSNDRMMNDTLSRIVYALNNK